MRLYLTIILADGNFVFPSLLGEDFKGDSKGLARMGLVLALPYLVRLILRAILWLLGRLCAGLICVKERRIFMQGLSIPLGLEFLVIVQTMSPHYIYMCKK